MKCPKYSKTIFKDFDSDFYICRNCGTLVAKTFEPAPMRERVKTPKIDPETKTMVYAIVDKFKESIESQRQSGASWDTITSLLAKANGARLNSKSVQKYALKFFDDPKITTKCQKGC